MTAPAEPLPGLTVTEPVEARLVVETTTGNRREATADDLRRVGFIDGKAAYLRFVHALAEAMGIETPPGDYPKIPDDTVGNLIRAVAESVVYFDQDVSTVYWEADDVALLRDLLLTPDPR